MRTRTLLVVVLSCLPIVPMVAADGANDAGLGGDASNDPAAPSILPAFGAYGGTLPPLDRDWYTATSPASAGGSACYELDAASTGGGNATLVVAGAGSSHSLRAPMSSRGSAPTKLVIAARQATPEAGFTQLAGKGSPLAYGFNLTATTTPDVASGTTPTPLPQLTDAKPLPGSCVGGRLDPMGGVGHTTDLFSFDGTAGEQVAYSLASAAPVQAVLLDQGGNAIGPTIPSNGLALVTLPATGTYYMSASAASGTSTIDYLLAMLLGPGESPCQPYCIAST